MRRPLVGLALCFAVGTWLGLTRELAVPVPLGAAVLLLLCAAAVSPRSGPRGSRRPQRHSAAAVRAAAADLVVFAAAACTAWALARYRTGLSSPDLPPAFATHADHPDVGLVGVIRDDPVRVRGNARSELWRFTVAAERIRARPEDSWLPVRATVSVRWWSGPETRAPRHGDKWFIAGPLERVGEKAPERPGPAARYRMGADRRRSRFMSPGHADALSAWCIHARADAARRLAAGIEEFPECVSTIHALVIGRRQDLPRDVVDDFAKTGTLHVFAVSGLHVGMVVLLIAAVLRSVGIPRTYWVIALAPMAIAYTLLTGARPSAVRAAIVAVMYFLAALLGRRADMLSSLAAAAVVLLAAAPQQLFDVGFILSFTVTAGLVVLYPRVEAPLRRLWQPDPLRLQPEPLPVRCVRSVGARAGRLFALSCSAWLVSSPLTAYFFGRFSPVALLGNLVVVPLAFLIVLAGSLSLSLGSFLSPLADLFNHAGLALTCALTALSRLLAFAPLGCLEVGTPPLWLVLACYGLMGLVATRSGRPHGRAPAESADGQTA